LRVLFLDIETTPMSAYTWGLWQQNVGINQIKKSTEMMCFGAQWLGNDEVEFYSIHKDGKRGMLKQAYRLMDEADVVVGWNSAAFDTKHLKREMIENGFKPPSPYKDLDLMRVVKSQFKFPSNKLDYVAQTLKVGAKVQHSGFDLWVRCMAKDDAAWEEMRTYQEQDVRLLVELYEKLKPWVINHPDMNITREKVEKPRPTHCPVCSSTKIVARGTMFTKKAKYQRYRCMDCGKWLRGEKIAVTTSYDSV
jgi:uncharacterized protein YprB with RNaseH-like and TPR domain